MSFLPLSEISAYGRKNWVIKARVSSRQTMRTFQKNNGQGRVLNIELLDNEGTEIRATFWNEAAEKYDSVLKQGQVYTFSGGSAKVANKKYTTIKHNYELNFDGLATVTAVEDDVEIKQAKFDNITPLRSLAQKEPGAWVNILVAVKELSPPRQLTTKAGKNTTLRKLVVVDSSECSMELTLWAEAADLPDTRLQVGTVFGVKSMKLGDFGGRSGSAQDLDKLFFDLTSPEFEALRTWWTTAGKDCAVRALSSENLGKAGATVKSGSLEEFEQEAGKLIQDQSLYWNCKAYFTFCRTKGKNGNIPLWYEACPTCNRKVVDSLCAKCNKTVQPVLRYMLSSLKVEDMTTERWVGAFDDIGVQLLGVKADKLKADGGETPEVAEKKFQAEYYKEQLQLRVRASVDTYEGQSRVRATVLQASPVDHVQDGVKLCEDVKQLYLGASDRAKDEVQDLLKAWGTMQQNGQVSDSWKPGFESLYAVAAC